MFNFFKEKIKSWLGKSKEKIEESAKKVEEAKEEIKKEEVIKEKKKEEIKKEGKPKKVKKRKTVEEKKEEKKIEKEEIKEAEKEEEIEEEKTKEEIKEIEQEEEKVIEEEKKLEKEKRVELEEPKEESFFKRLFKKEKKEEEKPKAEEVKEEKKETEEKKIKEIKEKEEEVKKEEPISRAAPTIEELEKERPSIFKKIKERFSYKLSEEDFEGIFEDLELTLLESNVALEAVDAIKKQLKTELVGKEIKKDALEEKIKEALKKSIDNILIEPDDLLPLIKGKKPFVMVFFGINGTGKTTTIAKVANLLLKNKISCVLAASDTFRAASIEQLEYHASKLNIKVVKHDYGADPAAVAFDAIKHAKAHDIQAVLIDTAGRMHTKDNLLSEMEKICRVTNPDLKIFVAESIAGNDAIQQARNFNEAIGIDGSILTKADVDEKGGTAISVSYITKKPILFLGTGQGYDNLEVFDKEKFIEELFS